MSKPIFISIIIDNFNYARFLDEAINSALDQDYEHYEIIVVDDASTDHSRAVIESYGDRIKPVFLSENSGQGAAFNAGLKLSQGDIICFLDADDLFYKNKLNAVAQAAQIHQEAILIYNRGYVTNINLKKHPKIFPTQTWQGNVRSKIIKTSETLFPPTSFLSFRRHFLEKILPMSSFMTRIDADFPLQFLAGLMGEVVVIDEPLTLYRLHGDNWFTNKEFIKLNLLTLKQLLPRIEKAFHFINTKLNECGDTLRLNPKKQRAYRRNLFIFKEVGWWDFLFYAIKNPNFANFLERMEYVYFGMKRRHEYNQTLSHK